MVKDQEKDGVETHIQKLIGGSNIHPTMVPFAMVVDSTLGEIDWWLQNP